MCMQNGWNLRKNMFLLPSEGATTDCFQPFPLGQLWTFKKKNCVARKYAFKKMRVGQVWPDHVSDRFRPFPTVSIFLTINWTNSVYGRLVQCKPMQTMTLKFFRATLVRVDCTRYCILTISNIPLKSQNPRSSWNLISQLVYSYFSDG